MYGNRNKRDLAVTRFYTSRIVYDRLYTINAFENALRGAFESGAHEKGVIFIQSDAEHRVRPCAPNKILLSNVVSVRPCGLYLPTNFQTCAGHHMEKAQRNLDRCIPNDIRDKKRFTEISRQEALQIIEIIKTTLKFSDVEFEWDAMRGLIDYYSCVNGGGNSKVLLMAETGRRLHRRRSGDKSGLSILGGTDIRQLVLDSNRKQPALVLLQQEGTKELDWAGHQFWWPILAAPATVEPCIFATKVALD
jgi:hypothetical protein